MDIVPVVKIQILWLLVPVRPNGKTFSVFGISEFFSCPDKVTKHMTSNITCM